MKTFYTCQTNDAITSRESHNKEIAYQAALEGIVLLSNKDNSLPIKVGNIALFGAGVKHTVKGGTGSGEVNERHSVNIYEGMVNAGFNVTNKTWLNDYDAEYEIKHAEYIKKNASLANLNDAIAAIFAIPLGRKITSDDAKEANCDTAIYVVTRQAGEGKDKKIENGEFDLDEIEVNAVKTLKQLFKKVILVINSGSYMDIKDLDNYADAILFFCQQGQEGGRAFADIISGKVSPSGKLTDCWAKSYDDVPNGKQYSYLSGDTANEYYNEGIYVGYRYYDTFKVEPRYHFGFGMSYTTFDIKTKKINKNKDKFEVEVEVTNTGKTPGKEVVQIYVSAPSNNIKKEYQRLVGFKKTRLLLPGEKELVKVEFDSYYMTSFCEKCACYVLEEGNYIVRVGNASNNTSVACVIKNNELIKVTHNENVCKLDVNFDEITPVVREITDDLTNIEVLELNKSDVNEITYKYEVPELIKDEKVNAILDSLTLNEMIDVCVGEGTTGMFTTNGIYAPGTVGRTTSKYYKKGLINVNLSDGPAGLRLLRQSALTKNNRQKYIKGCYLFSFMELFPKFILNFITGNEKKDKVLYQFTTAFPVGTSLAQSFNEELCEEIGKAISNEMSEYNITYWLAPAMNIHKNPLCGRNFEYLSEDPVVTGKIAAALCRGVQSIEGNYATIKHFACNNVEDNRQKSNSHVHERALREIYLKGFEIAIKEGNAKSVMTSYNLINGIYTPDTYDLCTKVLRNEWGFNGVVMTDWYSTNKKLGNNFLAIKAGNDMIMPGGGFFKKEIKQGYKLGLLSEEEIRRAAGNIIYSIIYSDVAKKVDPKDFDL